MTDLRSVCETTRNEWGALVPKRRRRLYDVYELGLKGRPAVR